MVSVPLNPPPRRILIIKPSAIGDVVHTLPILNLLKRRWPEARICWLAKPVCAPLVQNHPLVDEVILFEASLYKRAWHSPAALAAFIRLHAKLRSEQFDWALDFQGLFRSAMMTLASGAPVRVGFDDAREGAHAFYTHAVSSGGWWHQHAIGRYLHMAAAVGCEMSPVEFQFAVSDADRAEAEEMVPRGMRYAVIIPGSHWKTKQWPPEKYGKLAGPLRERFGLETVVLGGPKDVKVAANMPATINLVKKTSLPQTIALIERAEVVIANDSGPMHIASALGRPLVAIFGPTHPILTGPFGRLDSVLRVDLPCAPCLERKCFHHSCMQWLDVERVLDLAQRQMKLNGRK